MSFLTDFFEITDGQREVAVSCPFDHHTSGGLTYKESRPSASVNTEEKLFHCKSCGAGYSEAQFIQKLFSCNFLDARKIQRCFENSEDKYIWDTEIALSDETKERAKNLGISEAVLSELSIKTPNGTTDVIAFPVFMFDHLVDIRKYDPGKATKIKSRQGSPAGLILPFDVWRNSPINKLTIICAGEKDMAVARSVGFNAITLTGGELAAPKQLSYFKDRPVAIVYDNDDTGISGANKLATELYQVTQRIRVVTGFHEICKDKGQDITDFFITYGKSRKDLIEYIEKTDFFVPSEDTKIKYPVVDLLAASRPEYINKTVQSNIQVVAVSEATFVIPAAITAEKFKISESNDTMYINELRSWELNEGNVSDILHLMDNNFKEETVKKNMRSILKIPQGERCVKFKTLEKRTVFKAYVTDLFETTDTAMQPMEYTVYSIGNKLESGKKYLVTHTIVPHPYKGQQLVMLITDVLQANDSVSNFKLNETTKANLTVVREMTGTVVERIEALTEKVKGLLGYNGNNTLIQALDLSYHTALQFHFGSFKNVRGYLDTLIVGESRVGKSSTAEALRTAYGLGVFTSLAGNSATIPGLVGGSNKTAGGYQTRAGIIPQNHKGLIIFEEFGKSNANVVSELTDIRSSNEVRITRVAGTITLPALVRMIALTNVKSNTGGIKSIAAYPNGLAIITELVSTAEDIARYDLILVLSDRGAQNIDPYWIPEQPLDLEVYRTRVRWVWSRTAEQIVIDKATGLYVMEQANNLNAIYDCHIKLFGTEAWKKILRLAIAVAGYLVSTDDTFENIIVTKEHIDFAVNYYVMIYDNSTFKLKEYANHEKKFSTIDDEGVANLQDIYDKAPSLILQLEQTASASKNMLSAATGLNNDDLNKALNRMSRGLFIRFDSHEITPTERFRLGIAQLNKGTHIPRVGE